jgi:poly-gamma-glutamate synthesis protein (capsule biosynthesis protein)
MLVPFLALCTQWSAPARSLAQHAPAPGDGVMTMALTGDAIITRALSPYVEPEYLEMIEVLRSADMAFTNLEVLLHDYEPYPAHQSGGTWMRAAPEMADELVWAGFDMVSYANNHTGDYGPLGARLTREHARRAGLVGAGSGEDLHEAREAKFLDTADGRVALISLASTFTEHSVAGVPGAGVVGRPGLNPLRHRRWRVVTRDQLEGLRAGLADAGVRVPQSGDRLSVFGNQFEVGDAPGTRTSPDPDDVAAITAVVRNAKALADYVVVSIHAHERGADRTIPADFIVEFAHAAVEAGADAVVGHGPHVLRGVEIHEGKPILYSLGDFVFQNETLLRLPAENYARYDLDPTAGVSAFNHERYSGDTRGFPADPEIWEGAIAMPSFQAGELVELRLLPVTLGFGEPPSVRGRPLPASGALGRKIVQDLIERSAHFGTVVDEEDGAAVVRIVR